MIDVCKKVKKRLLYLCSLQSLVYNYPTALSEVFHIATCIIPKAIIKIIECYALKLQFLLKGNSDCLTSTAGISYILI